MSADNKRRRKAAEFTSPDYQFQGMALTYKRPVVAMMQRKSSRVAQPTRVAKEAAAQRPAKRVQFARTATEDDPLTTPMTTPEEGNTPGLQDGYAYKERLPQSFPHGLPPSSLEPGTTDLHYPPSQLFPEPPMGSGEELLMETPLQAVAQLRDATKNLQELVGELAASLWRTATQQERQFPQPHLPETPNLVPAVAAADRGRVHHTPVYISTSNGALDVNGYVPKEAILDTGASKVMLSKVFAAAMNIGTDSLAKGVEFVTASGAHAMPLGITKGKLKFTLGRGTEWMHMVEVNATVVDTTAYDVILGMEFVTAMRGAYDSYTELFTYRWEDGSGGLLSHSITAPCHTMTPC